MKAEIVAPAGSAQQLDAALNSGADAVYLGLNNFNARMKAGNFDIENLKETAGYIHSFNAKAYVALNTLVKQSELDDAALLAVTAFQRGADAIILQDLGLLKRIRRLNPSAVIHASTQMGIHNAEGAEIVRDLGVSRVILSREVPLCDIAEIKRRTGLEIEVFVHGALCVSFSGNCYFSALVSGYSGNRGRCMQLCRKSYRAVLNGREVKNGYLLSPYDLCFIKELKKLCDAGVDSFKIEGRLRRPEYVSETVRIYKKALSGVITAQDIDALKNIEHARGGIKIDYLRG